MNCTCKIEWRELKAVSSFDPSGEFFIVHCPLHAAAGETAAEVQRLRKIANDILSAIVGGQLVSMGSLHNTYMPQISTDNVAYWRAALAATGEQP